MQGRMESGAYEKVKQLAGGSAVVLFGRSECCMCDVAKHLLVGLGVAPTVIDLDRLGEGNAADVSDVLSRLCSASTSAQPPLLVFVGGSLLGGIESLIASHINGSLIPLLKQAGALWL